MATKATGKRAAKEITIGDWVNEPEAIARRGEVWGVLEWFWRRVILENAPHKLLWRWLTRKPYVVFDPWRLSRLAQAQKEAKLEEPAEKKPELVVH